MIFIIHQEGIKVIEILMEGVSLPIRGKSCTENMWLLAEEYPNEIIGWCEKDLLPDIDTSAWLEIFHHDLIMASYAVKTRFLPDTIGYIDQLPFLQVNPKVMYGTWRMSSDIGGIFGKALLCFKEVLSGIKNFDFLLNSVAKLGQQNGLFCFSAPNLFYRELDEVENKSMSIRAKGTEKELYSFTYGHYKTIRLFLITLCYIIYRRTFPGKALLNAFFSKKYFQKKVDFSHIEVSSRKISLNKREIDVIIPTMGRREYVLQVLEDLREQTLLPKSVIVVEQNPDPVSESELPELKKNSWPFKIEHIFIHQTGACNARNLALDKIQSDWIFFADDDNRMNNGILEKSIKEAEKYGVELLTLNYRQEGEALIFNKVKQWGTFGAGNSIVSKKYASVIRFDPVFEHGYGEDKDYGMQLRNAGCDIVYHPTIEILHLKAPIGGFREIPKQPWEKDKPKPSPTLMAYIKKYYSKEQVDGFLTELYFRFYFKQNKKNPFKYIKLMNERWRCSEAWEERIRKSNSEVSPIGHTTS